MENIVNIGKSTSSSRHVTVAAVITLAEALFVLYSCRLDCSCIWVIADHSDRLYCFVLLNYKKKGRLKMQVCTVALNF